MSMTLTEKILASHCGKKTVLPDELILCRVDVALGNDITAPLAIKEFESAGAKKVFDTDRVALIPDHFTPNRDARSANQAKLLKDFAKKYGIKHYYDQGEVGVEHALLPEKGLVLPGELIIGADSHTCTYGALGAFSTGVGSTDLAAAMITGECWFKVPKTIKFIYTGKLKKWVSGKDIILHTIGDIGVAGALYMSMEFTGPVIRGLDMSARMTICNMAIEAGAKNGIIEPDAKTLAYVKNRAVRRFTPVYSDGKPEYFKVIEYDCSRLEPQVSLPHLPENAKPVGKAGRVLLDQVVIGSCTNGRIEDLRVAAKILKNRKASKNLRLLIIPATPLVFSQALAEGLMEIFLKAGAVICPPTCGPCLGGHMGVIGDGETALATTNRNFVGRMGSLKSKVYLSGPAVAAASAITGRITHPDEVI